MPEPLGDQLGALLVIASVADAPAYAPAAHDIAEPIPLLRVICVP
jgi:hypothetical protein